MIDLRARRLERHRLKREKRRKMLRASKWGKTMRPKSVAVTYPEEIFFGLSTIMARFFRHERRNANRAALRGQ